MHKILFIFGTRPEAIKLAPLIKMFRNDKEFNVKVCSTGQHKEMLKQVLDFFNITPDYELNIMKENQSLFGLTTGILEKMEHIINISSPDLIFVQGDTTTAFVGALAGFYKKIPIVHIEAGLRSFNKYSPYPEEINRILAGHIADYHFAPTQKAKDNLYREGIKENVWVVGNTVIDALHLGLSIIEKNRDLKEKIEKFFNSKFNIQNSKLILVTAHRRESFGKQFENICYALKDVAEAFSNVEIVYPVHLNPNVRKPVFDILGNTNNIHLIEPFDYPSLIWLMNKAYIVVTDSGGIQEEAPSLGKPVLVIRNVTERTEGIEAKTAKIVGTKRKNIVDSITVLLTNKKEYERMSKAINPYGEGDSSKKIVEITKKLFSSKTTQ